MWSMDIIVFDKDGFEVGRTGGIYTSKVGKAKVMAKRKVTSMMRRGFFKGASELIVHISEGFQPSVTNSFSTQL